MTSPSHVTLMDKVRDDSSYTSQHSGRSEEKYAANTNNSNSAYANNSSVGTSNTNAQTKGKSGSNRASLESPFPHILQTSLESKEEENGYKGNVLSYVVKHLLSEFREHTKRKMDRVISFQTEEKEPPFISLLSPENDHPFRNTLQALGEMAKNCLSPLVRAMINWRSSQMSLLENSAPKAKGTRVGTEERFQISVDYLFGTAIQILLGALTRENLDENTGTQLETLAFEHFKPRTEISAFPIFRKGVVETAVDIKKVIADLYANILGIISKYRLRHITTSVFKEVGPIINSNPQKALPIIQGIRMIKLKIKTKHSLANSHEFVTHYFTLIKQAKSDQKQILIDVLVGIFRTLLETNMQMEGKSSVSYTEWNALIKSIYESIDKKKISSKKKDMLAQLPLLTVTLCLCDRDFFIANYNSLAEVLLRASPKLKHVSLDLLRILVETLLTKSNEPHETVNEKLQNIISFLFPPKKLSLTLPECVDGFVDLIMSIAKIRLDFAMQNIVFELLKGDISVAERETIALRAILGIAAGDKNKLPNKQLFKKVKTRTSSGGNLPINRISTTPAASIESYLPVTNSLVSGVLTTLDQAYGNLLLTVGNQRPLIELVGKIGYGTSGLELLKTILNSIPFIFPIKLNPPDLVNLLARYLIHLDENLREASGDAMIRIMYAHPEMRYYLILGVTQFALSIHDNKHTFTFIVLTKVVQLTKLWAEITTALDANKNDPEAAKELRLEDAKETKALVNKIEAVALVYLCCPLPRIRKLCIELLGYIREVDRITSKVEIPSDIRIMEVIDQSGPDIINNLRQDSRYRIPLTNEETVISIAITMRSGYEGQNYWTFCYVELLKLLLEFCAEPVKMAWEMVSSRFMALQPDDSSKSQNLQEEKELLLQWWKNYIVFACATVTFPEAPVSESNKKNKNANSSARELFSGILKFLKSPSQKERETAATALEKTNPLVYDILFEEMKPYELEVIKKGKSKRKERIRLRAIMSNILNDPFLFKIHSFTIY